MIEPGKSFDRAAEEYERGRPGYPDAILDVLPLAGDETVLDLGAGTGKLTRMLAQRFPQVFAVEPLDEMRAILQRELPTVDTRAGTAEAIPLRGAEVDAVFAGQAFHWFANDEAVAEIARVLRPGGLLVVVWNEPSELRPSPLPESYRRRFEGYSPSAGKNDEEPTWGEPIGRGPFGSIEHATCEHEQVTDRDAILAFAASVSWIAHRADAERRAILAELAGLLLPGEYRFPLCAHVHSAQRR